MTVRKISRSENDCPDQPNMSKDLPNQTGLQTWGSDAIFDKKEM